MKLIPRGRYTLEKNGIKFYNTGSGVSFCFKGSYAYLNIESEKGPGYVYIIRDFDYENKEKILVEKSKKIEVFFNDNEQHFVDIVKANEASDDFMIFGPLFTDGKIIDIDEKDKKFIKVYGDSSIAGFGILAHEGVANYLTNDGVENFCFRALYTGGFDYDIFAASGWGVSFSAWTIPKTTGIEKFRNKMCINSDINWNGKTPDFLIISLGTNDMAYILENNENSQKLLEKFVNSYENLIKKERENLPNLPVLMVYGSLKEQHVYSLIENTYKKLSQKLPNLYLVKLPGDNSAIASHSYVTYHKEMAEILKQKISEILSKKL